MGYRTFVFYIWLILNYFTVLFYGGTGERQFWKPIYTGIDVVSEVNLQFLKLVKRGIDTFMIIFWAPKFNDTFCIHSRLDAVDLDHGVSLCNLIFFRILVYLVIKKTCTVKTFLHNFSGHYCEARKIPFNYRNKLF